MPKGPPPKLDVSKKGLEDLKESDVGDEKKTLQVRKNTLRTFVC